MNLKRYQNKNQEKSYKSLKKPIENTNYQDNSLKESNNFQEELHLNKKKSSTGVEDLKKSCKNFEKNTNNQDLRPLRISRRLPSANEKF